MSKPKNLMKRSIVLIMAFVMLLSLLVFVGDGIKAGALVESVNGSDSLVRTSLAEIKSVITSIIYSDYLEKYAYVNDAKSSVEVDIFNDIYTNDDDTSDTMTTNATTRIREENDVKILDIADDGRVSFVVDIKETGFYNIEVEYWTGNIELTRNDGTVVIGKSVTSERMLLIDGNVPFKEARSISFTKSWVDTYKELDENYKVLENGSTFNSMEDKFYEMVTKYDKTTSTRIFQKDNNGNEMKPEKDSYPIWQTILLSDSSGYYNDPLKFMFESGERVLTFTTIREPLTIKSIRLVPAEDQITYDEYINEHEKNGAKDYTGSESVRIEAEYPTMTSDKTIYQLNDRTSAISEPQDASLIRLNSIGSDKWLYVGQWIEYKITVPEDGFYTIIPRSKQDAVTGMYVSRRVYVNGEIPFREASYLRFYYSDSWKTDSLNDGSRDFKFYLTKGENTLRFEVVLGDMAELLSEVESCLTDANAYYRKILMITGPAPDTYRDYNFQNLIPDVLRGLKETAQRLNDVGKSMEALTGSASDNMGSLYKTALNLERMGSYPDKIAATMGTLKTDLASLGSWLTSTQNQPLKLDYIVVQAIDAEHPKADANFWQKMVNEVKKFWRSFFADYNSVSSSVTEEEAELYKDAAIEVWTSASRDHAQIIRNLVDNDFIVKYNIPVNVRLVTAATLLPATLAGTGPDIAMGIDQGTPINYAIRSAVMSLNSDKNGYDFNNFEPYKDNPVYKDAIENGLVDTFDEVFARFADSASVPLTLYGETYGVPETMSFPMLFYRKDIFVELGLEVPNTWDEFNQVVFSLQAKKIDVGFPTGVGGSTILMYQQDEPMYKEGNYDYYLENYSELFENGENTYTDADGNIIPKTDGMEINLGSNLSLSAFKKVCQYFTMYDFPVSYAFSDRFRNGTMPMAVADYISTYNQLIIFAPEIKGLWEFTPLPGVLNEEDKTINNTTVAGITAMIMMRTVTEENNFTAWMFMQWWTSKDIQGAFGNEMEALLGPSAKQNTANLEALEEMAWSKDELDNLRAQFNAVQCTPQYPGAYIIDRYTNFAFLGVYNDKDEPVEKLRSYLESINSELTRKRKEFNLITMDDIKAIDDRRAAE